MKKNVLYTVTKGNRPAFMPGNEYSLGSWIENTTNKMSGWIGNTSNLAGSVAGNALGAIGTAVGTTANKLISGKYSTGVGNGIANIGGAAGSLISKVNPILGGIVSAGSGILGGVWNAGFGVNYNEDVIKGIKNNASVMENAGNALAQANTNAGVLDAARNMGSAVDIDYHDLGSTGFLRSNNALRREKARLDKAQNLAIAKQAQGLMLGSNQADQTTDDLVAQDFIYSYGGPLNPYGGALGLMQNDNYINAINNRSAAIMKANPFNTPSNAFGEGGGIHISPSKKGTFTAAASRHGMGVQEFASKVLANKDDYSPAMVKKANFARNAAKWHAFGGELGTNGTDWTNGLLFVDGGGTHQQNPLGGVPVGFDQNGVPNLVEEGETIWNDYVFSNRIKVPKAMFHTLGLGGAMKKGITFADASKKLAKESEQRPNDPISMAGLDASLSKLAAVQEAERMKKQMRDYVGLGNMAAYGGPVNKFGEGGEKVIANLRKLYGALLGYDVDSVEGKYQVDQAIYKDLVGSGSYWGNSLDYEPTDYVMKILEDELMEAYEKNPRQFVIKSIPEDRKKFRGDIAEWLRQNYWDISEDEVKSITEEVFNEAEPKRRQAANDSTFGEPVTKMDSIMNQLILENPFTIGRFYSPVLSNLKNVPLFDTSESNMKKYIRRMMEKGATFEEAYDYLQGERTGSNEREKYLAKKRMKEELESEFKNYDSSSDASSVQQNTNSDSETQQPENLETQVTPSNDPYLEWGIQNAMQEAARQEAERNYLAGLTPSELDIFNNKTPAERQDILRQVSQGISAGIAHSSGRGVARGSSGIIPYGYYTNGSDGYSTPTGFKVGENGRAYDYTQEYRDLVGKLTADDIRAWAKEHPNDTSLQSFIARGNNLDNLTDKQWRTGALDYKYGFMHHVADSILKGDSTPASAMEEVANDPYGAAIEPIVQGEEVDIPTPPDAVNGDPRAAAQKSDIDTVPVDDKRPRLDTRLRYAPVLGSAISALYDVFNTPDYTYPDKLEAAAYAAGNAPVVNPEPIGDYMRYDPFNTLFYANQLQANARATDRALGNTASPSAAAGMLANAYNTNNSLGNLYRQAEEYNLAQRQQVADFNRKTNMFNSQVGLEAAMANARNRMTARGQQMSGLAQVAALRDSIDKQYSASRSANFTNFFNNLGNIGRENFIFNQINSDPSRSYGYNEPWTGVVGYWPKFMEDQYQKWYDEQEKKKASQAAAATTGSTTATSGAYGGKLKRNKK